MAIKVITHEIGDNCLYINNKEYTGLNVSKVIVGVSNPEAQEIVVDENTGFNYNRDRVEGQEVYNLHTQRHRCWFFLDLETGSRGWFPGCEIHADIINTNVELKEQPDVNSTTLQLISHAIVKVLDITSIQDEPENGWYKVQYNQVGYIREEELSNLRYENPFA